MKKRNSRDAAWATFGLVVVDSAAGFGGSAYKHDLSAGRRLRTFVCLCNQLAEAGPELTQRGRLRIFGHATYTNPGCTTL